MGPNRKRSPSNSCSPSKFMTHERPGSNSTFEASTIPHRTTGLSPLSIDLEEDSAWERSQGRS
ncbi:hypothetical protein N7453_004371 [Penicillium expansum]|nr:hypothetical protein N7453_004371 [Penicillium expansum]